MKASLLASPLLTAVLLILFGYLAIGVALSVADKGGDDGGQSALVSQVEGLRLEKRTLEEELAWTATKEFVEQEARNKLYLVKSNETVVVYPEEAEVLAAKRTANEGGRVMDGGEGRGFVGEWMELFGF